MVQVERSGAVDHRRANRAFGGYQPGLDGMRGVGMAVMLGYHGGIAHTRGAIFALSQFFTVSGFLITALLLEEQGRSRTIDLRAFWSRRFRRLAPAALAGLAVAVVFGATIASPTQAADLPTDVIGALTYTVNWVFIWQDQSYVDLFSDPSPIQQYWSLAIEEQFYLLLPLSLLALRRARLGPKRLALLFGAGAVASTAWTWHLFDGGASIDRLYYGTDTRIGEILVGATFAAVLHHVGREVLEDRRRLVTAIAIPATLLSWWFWSTGSITGTFTWHGGFLVNALLSLAAIAAVIAGRNPLVRLYSLAPLTWLGRLTYSIYIFHWPIFLWLDEARTGLSLWPLFTLRVLVTLAAATASYYLIEQPIRRGASLGSTRPAGRALALLATGAVIVAASIVFADGTDDDPQATFRDDGSDVPVASADGSLDIVVIYAEGAADIARGIEQEAEDTAGVTVAELVPLACTSIDTTGASPTCTPWDEEWPRIVEQHDPDTVLLLADAWDGTDLAAPAAELGTTEAALATDLLEAGVTDLTSAGATVLWSSSGSEWMELGAQRTTNPLIPAVFDLDVRVDGFEAAAAGRFPSREETDHATFVAGAASALIEDAALHQRGAADGRTKVLILGDSQSRSLGYGLERWGDRTGEAWVWNAATPGCGLLSGGRVVQDGREVEPDPMCESAVSDAERKVEQFEPDIVLVLSSSWDLEPRRLDGWDEPGSPGDERFDAYVVESYTSLVDTIEDSGAEVVWFVPPCPGDGILDFAGPETLERYLGPLPVLQDTLIPTLVRERPSVEVFDLDSILCPADEPLEATPDGDPLRPDGLHFSVEGSIWFADAFGDELLALARDGG